MAIERWELEQRSRGNTYAADMARILREQHGDVPLPTTEALPDIQRFTPEAREELETEGYLIYELTGQSIKTLRDAGRQFWSTWHKDFPELEAMQSRLSEVAIDPKALLLRDSQKKTLRQQEQMVKRYSDQFREVHGQGVEVVIGEMPDYVELAFAHLGATGERLFGEKYDYNYTRTKTPTGGSGVASVGSFGAGVGLGVDRWLRDEGNDGLFVAPLVVPKAA